jgi:hypothetical protein
MHFLVTVRSSRLLLAIPNKDNSESTIVSERIDGMVASQLPMSLDAACSASSVGFPKASWNDLIHQDNSLRLRQPLRNSCG